MRDAEGERTIPPQDEELRSPRLIAPSDVGRALIYATLLPVAWLLPERAWPALVYAISWLSVTLRPGRTRRLGREFHSQASVRRGFARSPREAVRRADAFAWESRLQLLRSYRPGGWHPRLRLEGSEHLEAALAAGTGAVLWVAGAPSSSLVVKMALHEQGYRVTHLSRVTHSISTTRLGARFLNPIVTRIEERFLEERVVIGFAESPTAAMRQLRGALRENDVVSITMGDHGAHVVWAPFFHGEVALATGAPRVALASGAPLLPVCAVREGNGRYTVHVLAPHTVAAGASRETAVRELVEAAAVAIAELPDSSIDSYMYQPRYTSSATSSSISRP